jgi:hypothetical protein
MPGFGFGYGFRRPRGASGPVAFDPALLFAGGEQGTFFDFQNAAARYADTGLTTPATSAVGAIRDLSGNGHHATQPSAGQRPVISSFSGFASALFDGIDDYLVTPSIDFSGTDKISIFAVLRKLSDASSGIACELSANASLNESAFYLAAPSGSGSLKYATMARGTAPETAAQRAHTGSNGAAPDSAVLTATHDISGDRSTLRRNGVAAADATGDKGAGNFGNYPLYIGRRAGSSLPYNGHLAALLVIGRLLTAGEIASLEAWGAAKGGVALG